MFARAGRLASLSLSGLVVLASVLLAQDAYAPDRESMVKQQLEARGIRHAAVLQAMRSVPRHEFVAPLFRRMAYRDHPLPIGHGATISQPYIVAFMTELLHVSKNDRVLEIGTGSGYQAAVLSQLASHVYTIEIVPELAASSRERLTRLGYRNVTVRAGDGFRGWPEAAPFSRILLTAAPVEIPAALLAQLSNGGRLVAPVGARWMQELRVVSKSADGKVQSQNVGDVSFVPMVPAQK